MKEEEKNEYLERYEEEKKKGVPFYPNILFKDAVVSLIVFVALLGLAFFLGAPLEERANPADTSYTPRPEWYFLFLFQLLKYFPGRLEVIGAIVLPTIVLLLLAALPLLDRSARRHFSARPLVIAGSSIVVVGIIVLTVLSVVEAPPPAETAQGDPVAALYTENCAPCHGPSISVPMGTNLHSVIALGKHEDMPAWNADLTSDEIDALAGFIQSPDGNQLFTQYCGECHAVSDLVAGDLLELRRSIDLGAEYDAHVDVEISDWTQELTAEQRTSLLNFLAAPDGQRLFALNCSSCHGRSVAFSGDENELAAIISQGGLHLDMPPWRDALEASQLDALARFVVDPSSEPNATDLFASYCAACHGERVPQSEDFNTAREVIASGGAHELMPVWGEVLTSEQLAALVSYTLDAAQGVGIDLGQQLFAQNCASCHGDFGEGGANPALQGDIIAPISTAEYLTTRDDFTLRAIIAQGQPDFGMSPFGSAYGGPLDDDEIDAIVVLMRSWEANPPVEFPPEVVIPPAPLSGEEIYGAVCAQCHGVAGEGLVGPELAGEGFASVYSDQELFDIIARGRETTAMIAWGEILTSEQIDQLVLLIRQLSEPQDTPTPSASSFSNDVAPILQAKCAVCHGSLGGWSASSYENVMTTGDNAPVVIPGDPDGSLLAQWLLGTVPQGGLMPPSGMLPQEEIQLILDWIAEGAPDN
jgi:mono/diheme cytochrome c family protein